MMKKWIPVLFILMLLAGLSPATRLVQASEVEKIDPELNAALDRLPPGEMITVIVSMAAQADLSAVVAGIEHTPDRRQFAAQRQERTISALKNFAAVSQRGMQARLDALARQGRVRSYQPFWVFNAFSITASADAIRELASLAEVARLSPDEIDIMPAAALFYAAPELNLSAANIPALWDLGFTGQGVVVANMDSGVDASHPELAARWRGGSNSWFDPYGQHASPADLSGHGTQTMGIMVAGDAGGSSIGAAPGAQWIAVKIFNDSGSSTATAIHQGFQWLLDPDGNPSTADAPQVVNNSWTFSAPGCNLAFQPDLQALRAAGILPVFAAGNYGPGSNTSRSPANYPEALAVGAVNNSGSIYAYSSRGPSNCGESSTIYPDLVAPGVNINTTDRYGFYVQSSGTSFSAPHVSGALALLLSAFSGLSPEEQQAALLNSAVDSGSAGPDNSYGYGRLDALAAYQWLLNGNPPAATATPTLQPSPTATNTPAPTATPAPSPTATAVVPAASLHSGDLEGVSQVANKRSWVALVTVTFHDEGEAPLAGVTVSGAWSSGTTSTCVTDTSGTCQMQSGSLNRSKQSSVSFALSSAVHPASVYQPALNHDADGDSNGTAITIIKP